MQIFEPYLLIAKVSLSYQEPNLGSSAPILAHFYSTYSTVREAHQISPIVLECPTLKGDLFMFSRSEQLQNQTFYIVAA